MSSSIPPEPDAKLFGRMGNVMHRLDSVPFVIVVGLRQRGVRLAQQSGFGAVISKHQNNLSMIPSALFRHGGLCGNGHRP